MLILHFLLNSLRRLQYCFFNEVRYARNLVERNQYFELIVICWKAGQQSPIHNHEGSRSDSIGYFHCFVFVKILHGPI